MLFSVSPLCHQCEINISVPPIIPAAPASGPLYFPLWGLVSGSWSSAGGAELILKPYQSE